jgi:hypothetical protein
MWHDVTLQEGMVFWQLLRFAYVNTVRAAKINRLVEFIMSTPTLRTTAHSYPQEEIDAMTRHYGGKRCIITKTLQAVNWCHVLDSDAALETSNGRVRSNISFRPAQRC